MSLDLPIVFDFDGTMVHSNELKHEAFFDVVGDDSAKEIISKVLEKGKVNFWDRYTILQEISATTNLNYIELVQNYNEILQVKLLQCEKRTGIDQFLQDCSGLKIISSATPTSELKKSVKKIFNREKFDLIIGDGAGKKIKNLEFIIKKFSLVPESITVIGDGQDDYESALNYGCYFLGISGGSLASTNLKLHDNYLEIARAVKTRFGYEIDEVS